MKAAGIAPLQHFLAFGQAEGRAAAPAVGRAGDIAGAHGFDAEFYLLANPDVAAAATTSLQTRFAFALSHFQTNGWQEGRAPNLVFDPKAYLAANPDVAAARIDPLTHYEEFGWREGRDPSATFHVKEYLAANPDVAAAHIDPMLHYLTNGLFEGRLLA